jgi:tetraacyldisaccharide 4'-kinase
MKARHLEQIATGRTIRADALEGRRVHAVAGIGHPERFFALLEQLGLVVERHPLPDHARLAPGDFGFAAAEDLVIMTEKDAIKCRTFGDERLWCLVADLDFMDGADERLMRLVAQGLEREAG